MLAFVDESGQPHPHDAHPISSLVAVCLQENEHRSVSRQLHTLKKYILGHENVYELKGLELLNERTFRRIPEKKELAEAAFDLLSRLGVTIFAVIMPRPKTLPNTPDTYLPAQQLFLLQRINALAEEREEPALVIYDGQGMNIQGKNLSSCFSSYIFKVAEHYKVLNRIVDTPLFVDSRITPGIQLADLAASVIRQYHEHGLHQASPVGNAYLSAIDRYYNKVKSKTRNDLFNDRGIPLWGFYSLREESFFQRSIDVLQQQQIETIEKVEVEAE